MMTLIAAAVLSGTPSAGDVVATWIHRDEGARVEITLDADGGCSIVSTRRWNGATYRASCGYVVTGSTVQVRTANVDGAHWEFSLVHDRRTDEMMLGDDDGVRFFRTSLEKR